MGGVHQPYLNKNKTAVGTGERLNAEAKPLQYPLSMRFGLRPTHRLRPTAGSTARPSG